MSTSVKLGTNRTGTQTSPKMTEEQIEATRLFRPDVEGDASRITEERIKFMQEAEPLGTVPIPATAKGMLKSGLDKMMGKSPELLVDKLGERLAYERTGVRLYEAFIAKAIGAHDADPELVPMLREIQEQEIEHMTLLRDAIETLGCDPTAVTPCADVTGVMAMGIMQTLTDPRTNLMQCLNAMLTIELTDNAAWEMLIDLAQQANHPNIAASFEKALRQENVHLDRIKSVMRNDLKAQMS
jgi:rubrerythrin